MTLDDGLERVPSVINVGLELFAAGMVAQGAEVVHVEWRPPAGDPDIATLLGLLEDEG